MNSPSKIIYLKEDKNLICVEGIYIDLNMVTRIIDHSSILEVKMVDGESFQFQKKTISRSYKDVPDKLRYYEGTYEEVCQIKKEMRKDFEFIQDDDRFSERYGYRDHGDYHKSRFTFYNATETDKLIELNDIRWANFKSKILNKWIGSDDGTKKLFDKKVINLINEYLKINSDDRLVLTNIEKIFGYSVNDIIGNLELPEHFKINIKGEVIKL